MGELKIAYSLLESEERALAKSWPQLKVCFCLRITKMYTTTFEFSHVCDYMLHLSL